MKLIFKALYNKKYVQYGVLVLVLVLTVMSMQMSATVTLKNKTMIQKVDEIKAAHTNIYIEDVVNMNYEISNDDMLDYFNRLNEENDIDLIDSVENTYYNILYPINPYDKHLTEKDVINMEAVYLEGYISKKGTNQYKVLEGKSFQELKGNEILINEPCARDRERKNQKVIGGTYYLDHGNKYKYKIVGVYEDPAYFEDATSSLQDSSILKSNRSKVRYHAIGNFDTVKKQSTFFWETNEEGDGDPRTISYKITQKVHKVHLKDYSIENESTLLSLTQINSVGSSYATYQPLYYQLQGDNTTQSIFKYLSYTLLAALIVSDFFVFYAFFKRKLDEDRNKLAMMVLCGIKQKNIIKAYLSELGILAIATISIMGVLNIIGYLAQLQKHPYMSIFFDTTPLLLGITLILAFTIFIMLGIMIVFQIKHFFTNNLTRVMKEKDLTIQKPSRIKISYKGQLIQMAIRDLMANKFKFARVVFASAFLILCMMMTYCSYQTMDKLYNRDTIGLTFDYTIGRVNERQYEHLKDNYIKDVSILQTNTKYFMEKTGELDGVDIYKYYEATLVTLYDHVNPFLTKESGVYPKPGIDHDAFGNLIYYTREALLPRKLIDVKNADMNENAAVSVDKKMLGYTAYPYQYYGWNQDDFMYIKGGINSLINNGYVAFTAMTAGKQHPVDDLVLNNTTSDMGNGIVINLKKDVSHKDFENYLKQQKIEFTSYDAILEQMKISNHEINQNTFAVMVAVMTIMIFMFIVLTLANIMEESMHKREEHDFMLRTGWSRSFVSRLNITKSIMMLMFACLIALILFFPIKMIYFNQLFQILGIFSMSTRGTFILVIPVMIIICFIIGILIMNHKKKVEHR